MHNKQPKHTYTKVGTAEPHQNQIRPNNEVPTHGLHPRFGTMRRLCQQGPVQRGRQGPRSSGLQGFICIHFCVDPSAYKQLLYLYRPRPAASAWGLCLDGFTSEGLCLFAADLA